MVRPNNLNEDIQELTPLKEDLASSLQNRVIPTTNQSPIREGSYGTALPFYSGSSAHDPGLFGSLMGGEREGGGMGGGSEDMKVDPMDTAAFVKMNLNPYLTDNIHSFKHGGRTPKYDGGGMYTQKANEMIAMNQIANLMGNVNSPYTADKGMKYKYNHGGQHTYNNDGYGLDEGGITIQEANTSGKRYVINQDGSATILPYQGDLPGIEISRVDMPVEGGMETPSASLPWDRQAVSRMSPPKDIYKETGGLEDQYAPLAPPMANNGMRMNAPQPSNMAGAGNQLGALAAKLQQEMPNPQDAMNMVSKLTGNQPMANQGMKMRKRYTQGGRF